MPVISLPSTAMGPFGMPMIPGNGSGGEGGGGSPVVSNQTFTNSISSASGGSHTYALSGSLQSFGEHNKLATNGTYTIVSDDGINITHTGAGTTGSNKEILNAGWAWVIRNSDGAVMKSWNGMLNGDYGDSSNLVNETDGGRSVTSKFITAQFGISVGINDNYFFTGAPYRPVGGSISSNNYASKNAYIFAYKLSDFSLVKVWKVNDFSSQLLPRTGGAMYSSFGSGLMENGMVATNDGLYIPAAHVKSTFTDNSGGAVVYFDISDADPNNWGSTPDTVIKNPINIVSNPTTNWGQGNYSNGNFGQSGAYVYDTKLIVAHATRAHNYNRSGTSFTEVNSYTPNYYIGDRYQAVISTGKVAMVNGGGVGSTLTLRDPSNSWSQDWQKTLPGDGYPGYNVQVDIDHDKILSGDGFTDANGTDDGLITVYNSDGTVHATVNNPTSANTKFGRSFVVKNAKLVALINIGGSSSAFGLQFMDLGYGTSGGGGGGTTFGGKSISQIGTPWVFDGPDANSAVDVMTGLRWVDSGNKLVAAIQTSGSNNSYGIYEFDTTTAYSTQTADISYNNVNFLTYNEIADADFSPKSIEFNADGSRGYFGEDNEIFSFSMSTNYDISTATGTGHTKTGISHSAAPYGYGGMEDIKFNSDGTKMFISEVNGNDCIILEFSLSSAYDVTTKSTNPTATFVPTTAGNSTAVLPSIHFNSDGTKMWAVGAEVGGAGVRWLYEYDLSTGFDVSTMSYNNEKLDLETLYGIDLAQALTFNNDFSKIYIACGNDGLFEFQWGTASGGGGTYGTLTKTVDWDTIKGSVESTVDSWGFYPAGYTFNNDGTKMYVCARSWQTGTANDYNYTQVSIAQYNLSTAYDVATATYDKINNTVVAGLMGINDVAWNADGTKAFIAVAYENTYNPIANRYQIWECACSSAYDVSGINVSSPTNVMIMPNLLEPQSLLFSHDGKKIFAAGDTEGIFTVDLTTAYSFTGHTTGHTTANSCVTSAQMGFASNLRLWGISFSNDGITAFITQGQAGSSNQQWKLTLATAYDLTSYSNTETLTIGDVYVYDKSLITYNNITNNLTFGSFSGARRWKYNETGAISSSSGGGGTPATDISDATLDGSAPAGLFSAISSNYDSSKWATFGNNGTLLYLPNDNSSTDEVASFNLNPSYDITTANQNTNVMNFSIFVNNDGLIFNPDGTKMITFEVSGDPSIKQYDLNTAWNHGSGASATPSATISNDSSGTQWDRGIFADSGSKFYAMQANTGGKVKEWTCSTPGDLSTASAVGSSNELVLSVAQGAGESRGIAMNSSGTRLYIGFDANGDTNEQIFQYDLSTPFDLSTATYNNKVLSNLRNDNFSEIRGLTLVNDTDLYVHGLKHPSGGMGMWLYKIPAEQQSGGSGSNALENGWVVRSDFTSGIGNYPNNEKLYAIDGDSSGNIYVAGYDAAINKILVAQYDKDGSRQWTFEAGGYGSNTDRLEDTAVDDPGNMISVGYTGASPLDGIIVKYANNVHTWTKTLSDGGSESWIPLAVTVDKTQSLGGDIYVAGATEAQSNSGNRNPFVVKLNSNGAVQWAKKYDHGGQQSSAVGIALDSNGDIFVSGSIHEQITGGGYSSGMVMKLSGTDGSIIWQKFFDDEESSNGYHSDQFQNCVVTPEGDVLTCGWVNKNYLGTYYGVVLKLSGTDGSVVWQRHTNNTDGTKKIAVNSAGKIYTFGDNEVLFVYASDGTLEQEWKITGASNPGVLSFYLEDIFIDHKDNAVITGFWYPSGANYSNGFIVKLPATIQAGTSGDFVITAQSLGDSAGELNSTTFTSYTANTMSNVTTGTASNLTPGSISATTTGPNEVTGVASGGGGGGGSPTASPNLSTASYSTAFDTANETTAPKDLQFNSDGTKLFVVCEDTRKIYRYSITDYSIASASYDSVSYDFSGTTTAVNGFTFNGDGTSFYLVGNDQGGSTPDTIFQFDMGTAYDIANASYSKQGTTNNNGSSADPTTQKIIFNNDGTKVYISGSSNSRVYQFKLTTAYDISTISPDVSSPTVIKNLYLYGDTQYLRGMQWGHDGTRLYVIDSEGATPLSIDLYTFTTPYDLDTGTYNSTIDISGNSMTRPEGLAIKPDGTSFIVLDGHKTFATAKAFEFTTTAIGYTAPSTVQGWISTISDELKGYGYTDVQIRSLDVDSNDNIIAAGDSATSWQLVVKIKSDGTVDSAASLGATSSGLINRSVAVDSGGNIFTAGEGPSMWSSSDGHVMRLTSSLTKSYDDFFGEGYNDEHFDIVGVGSDAFVVGESQSYAQNFSQDPKGHLLKYDSSGGVAKTLISRSSQKSHPRGISTDGTDVYVIGKDVNSMWIAKVNNALSSVTWGIHWGSGSAESRIMDIDTNSSGESAAYMWESGSLRIAKLASDGTATWRKYWDKASTDHGAAYVGYDYLSGYGIKLLANGSVALRAGSMPWTTDSYRKSFYIVVFDSTGTVTVQKEFRLTNSSYFLGHATKSLVELSDGKIVTAIPYYTGSQVWKNAIFKFDPTDTTTAINGTHGDWEISDITDGTAGTDSTSYGNGTVNLDSSMSMYFKSGYQGNSNGFPVSSATVVEGTQQTLGNPPATPTVGDATGVSHDYGNGVLVSWSVQDDNVSQSERTITNAILAAEAQAGDIVVVENSTIQAYNSYNNLGWQLRDSGNLIFVVKAVNGNDLTILYAQEMIYRAQSTTTVLNRAFKDHFDNETNRGSVPVDATVGFSYDFSANGTTASQRWLGGKATLYRYFKSDVQSANDTSGGNSSYQVPLPDVRGSFSGLLGIPDPVWYGDRGLLIGGSNGQNDIQYFDITTLGNAVDFGDLDNVDSNRGSCSNGYRAITSGGVSGSKETIEVFNIHTLGNSQPFGNLLVKRYSHASFSDGTIGVMAGGIGGPSNNSLSDIEYITIDTLGNGTDFGDMTSARKAVAGAANSTRGLIFGGWAYDNTIEYVTINTPAHAIDFGDLLNGPEYHGATGSATTAIVGGGDISGGRTNVIQSVQFDTPGNATDFGDLTEAKKRITATSNLTRAVFIGGSGGSGNGYQVNTIEYVTIATPGNAADFGDLLQTQSLGASTSGNATDLGHGTPLPNYDRAIFSGGTTSSGGSNPIEYMSVSNGGNAVSFGTLSTARGYHTSAGNRARALMVNGETASNVYTNNIEYVVPATLGNGVYFGTNMSSSSGLGGCANDTYALFAGGGKWQPGWNYYSNINYVTIATTGSASYHGSLSSLNWMPAGASGGPGGGYAYWAGGAPNGGNFVSTIERVAISTSGSSSSFGNLSMNRGSTAGVGDSTYILFAGGGGWSDSGIDQLNATSGGTATKVGDLHAAKYSHTSATDKTTGLFAGGYGSSMYNNIEKVTIASAGNAVDVGDLLSGRYRLAGTAGSSS